jgi:hypothetical protein
MRLETGAMFCLSSAAAPGLSSTISTDCSSSLYSVATECPDCSVRFLKSELSAPCAAAYTKIVILFQNIDFLTSLYTPTAI